MGNNWPIFYFINLGKKKDNNKSTFPQESFRKENLIPESLRYRLHLDTQNLIHSKITIKTVIHIIKDQKISSVIKPLEKFLVENLSMDDFCYITRLGKYCLITISAYQRFGPTKFGNPKRCNFDD